MDNLSYLLNSQPIQTLKASPVVVKHFSNFDCEGFVVLKKVWAFVFSESVRSD